MKKAVVLVLCASLLIASFGCGQNVQNPSAPEISVISTPLPLPTQTSSTDITTPAQTSITFSASSVAIEGEGAEADGTNVVISKAGTYTVSGGTDSGSITVDAPDAEVYLVLDAAGIKSIDGPAILFRSAKNPVLTLLGTSESNMSGGSTQYPAAVYSAVPLTIDGTGSLYAYGTVAHAIAGMQGITIKNGIISTESLEDGICTLADNSGITIENGEIYINANRNGIASDGDLTINGGHIFSFASAGNNGMGVTAEKSITVQDGTLCATGTSEEKPTIGGQDHLTYVVPMQQSSQNAVIRAEDSDSILDIEVPVAFSCLVYSSPDIQEDTIYALTIGGMQFGAGTSADAVIGENPVMMAEPTTSSALSSETSKPSASPTPSDDNTEEATDSEPELDEPLPSGFHPDFSDPDFGDKEPGDHAVDGTPSP